MLYPVYMIASIRVRPTQTHVHDADRMALGHNVHEALGKATAIAMKGYPTASGYFGHIVRVIDPARVINPDSAIAIVANQ